MDLVGTTEIAERLAIQTQTVRRWRQRHPDFPDPVGHVAGNPAWHWADIRTWCQHTHRHILEDAMNTTTATGAAAPFRLSALYDAYGVDFLNGDGHIEWVPATNPTVEDRDVDDDGTVLNPGNWVVAEADDIIREAGYRRTSEWVQGADEIMYADVERDTA